MASPECHLALAKKHREAMDFLLGRQRFPMWSSTMAFYVALQIVEALLSSIRRGTTSHNDRERELGAFPAIYIPYMTLKDASMVARYMQGGEWTMTNEQVETELAEGALSDVRLQVCKVIRSDLQAAVRGV